MKVLEFSGESTNNLLTIFSIFSRDPTKLETRSAIRQNARIMDKLEDLILITPKEDGSAMLRVKDPGGCKLELDDADFEALHGVIRAYKPTNLEARIVDNVNRMFERE